MTPEQIEVVVKAVAEQRAIADWWFHLVFFLATVVMSAFGAYFGAYWKKRGEHFATKQDFESLLDQITQTTKATTAIRSQIEHADWTRKEYITLKRQKAEALLGSVQKTMAYIDATSMKVFYGDLQELDTNPGKEVSMLVVLYFPELLKEALVFGGQCSLVMSRFLDYQRDVVVAKQNSQDISLIRTKAQDEFLELKKLLFSCANYIEFSVANSMADLAGVERPYGKMVLVNPTDKSG